MKSNSIVITEADMARLSRLIQASQPSLVRDQSQLAALDQALQGAEMRTPGRTPKTVITMNSTVRVRDFSTQKEESFTLVFPEEANIARGLISVLAPLGIALLGHRRGEVIEAKVPGGIRRLQIREVRQKPVAATQVAEGEAVVTRADVSVEINLAA